MMNNVRNVKCILYKLNNSSHRASRMFHRMLSAFSISLTTVVIGSPDYLIVLSLIQLMIHEIHRLQHLYVAYVQPGQLAVSRHQHNHESCKRARYQLLHRTNVIIQLLLS